MRIEETDKKKEKNTIKKTKQKKKYQENETSHAEIRTYTIK